MRSGSGPKLTIAASSDAVCSKSNPTIGTFVKGLNCLGMELELNQAA